MPNTADALLLCPFAFASGIEGESAPANLESRDDVDPIMLLGSIVRDAASGKSYIYVRFDNGVGNVAAVAGNLAYIHTLAEWDPDTGKAQVTSDQSDSVGGAAATTSIVAGVFVNVPTDLRYTFLQCGGRRTNMNVTAAAIAGSRQVSSATDGRAISQVAADIVEPFAILLEAES